MKKYLSLLTVLALVLLVNVSTTKAEDASVGASADTSASIDGSTTTNTNTNAKGNWDLKNGTKRSELRTEIKQKMETFHEDMDQKITTLRAGAMTNWAALKTAVKGERDATKAKMLGLRIELRENALGRFDNVVTRLSALEDRTNTLIDKLSAKGVDVTDAQSSVATADTDLTNAKDKIAQIDALLAKSINELSADDKAKLKTLVGDTQTLLKGTRTALQDAIKSLRTQVKIKMEAEANAKTGSNTNTNNQ